MVLFVNIVRAICACALWVEFIAKQPLVDCVVDDRKKCDAPKCALDRPWFRLYTERIGAEDCVVMVMEKFDELGVYSLHTHPSTPLQA